MRRTEVAALLAVAQDHAFGQPPGSQLRATVVGQRLATAAGADVATTWWASALRFLGCTSHAYDLALVYGDEIALRGETLRADNADPVAMLRLLLAHAGAGLHGVERIRTLLSVLATGRAEIERNFRTACEVGDTLAVRLGLDAAARDALAASFERWNGRGFPHGRKGRAIPLPMRVAQLAQEYEVLARVTDTEAAAAAVRERSGRTYDPALADLVVTHGADWYAGVADPWDAALALAPDEGPLDGDETYAALLVLADFADLKSPWRGGHSRAVAALVRAAAGPDAEAAALVHDLGVVAVPNTVWDKPGPLTRDERDLAEMHPLVTDQLLRRVPDTATYATGASSAHERVDGSGYHRHATSGGEVARVLAAADAYQAMTSDRPYRPALSPDAAATALRAEDGLDGEAVERVLAAAGHRRARPALPAGLTAREVEVLRLLARGHTTKEVAAALVVSAKTADHHVQHVYRKIGVSTRGAATLFAIEHGLLP